MILFRQFGPGELRIARLFRLLGFEIRFLDPVGTLRSEQAVQSLANDGMLWLRASEFHGINAFTPIAEIHRLTLNFIDRVFPVRKLAVLAQMMPEPANDRTELRILLYELVRRYLNVHGVGVAVARAMNAQGYRVWLWEQDSALFSKAGSGIRNAYPALALAAASGVRRVSGQILRRLSSASRPASAGAVAPQTVGGDPVGNAEVLYFPHKGPYYGQLFEKTQYYSDRPGSAFHRSKICHVELAEEMSPSVRNAVSKDYERAGLAVHWLPPLGATRISLSELLKTSFRVGFVGAILGLSLRHRLRVLMKQLAAFPQAKLALLGYETLFPRIVASALRGRGIRVAAAQERFIQVFHPGFSLILDHYLVHGTRPEQAVRDNPLCKVDRISVTGDLRQPIRKRERASGPHRCLVLDYHSSATIFADAIAIAAGRKSNRMFLEDVLALSAEFPDVQFTVRGKDANWMDMPCYADLVARLPSRPNLSVDRDYSFDRSTELLLDSDSIIARHTSLADQGLALGMPVLFHERMATGNESIAAIFDYSPYPLLTRSYEELRDRFRTVVRDGNVIDARQIAELRRDFYNQPSEIAARERAQDLLHSMLLEPAALA